MVVQNFCVMKTDLVRLQEAVKSSGMRFCGNPIVVNDEAYVEIAGDINASNQFTKLFWLPKPSTRKMGITGLFHRYTPSWLRRLTF